MAAGIRSADVARRCSTNAACIAICLALALARAGGLSALALVSYDPADPVAMPVAPLHLLHQPDPLVHPPHAAGQQHLRLLRGAGGRRAVHVAGRRRVLPRALAGRARLSALAAARDRPPALRMIGWIASLAGVTTIAAIAFPALSPGPVIGSGGYLGALGKVAGADALRHDRRTDPGRQRDARRAAARAPITRCSTYCLFLYRDCLPADTSDSASRTGRQAQRRGKRNRTDLDEIAAGRCRRENPRQDGRAGCGAGGSAMTATRRRRRGDETPVTLRVVSPGGRERLSRRRRGDDAARPAGEPAAREESGGPQEGSGRPRARRADAEDERGQPGRGRRTTSCRRSTCCCPATT